MKKSNNKKIIEREIFPKIARWLKEKEIIVINGARQTGKTTLLFEIKKLLTAEKVVYVNFEEIEILEDFLRAPKEFVSLQLAKNKKTYFLFDEFQYVKNAGKILKILYDSFPQAKFIVTGSSSLKIRQIASYLVGRAIFFNLYPFSFAEFLSFAGEKILNLWKENQEIFEKFIKGEKINLTDKKLVFEKEIKKLLGNYLIFGGYPAIAISPFELKKERLKAIVETYIEKDIIRYLLIGNFLEFKNLAKVLALQISNLINYYNLTNDLKLNRRELNKFISILENTFIVQRIIPFSTNKITEIKKTPKVYFYDLGLRNYLISDFRKLEDRGDRGALIENFVFQNLTYRGFDLNFWRSKQKAEVDFVLRMENQIIPIEVKDQEFDRPKISRSFTSFIERYQPKRGIILTRNYFKIGKYQKTQIMFFPYGLV